MPKSLDKRLLFVTGKGGVGKTTVAAALGLAAARAGKRTIICEVAAQERLSATFGRKPVGTRETEVAPSLHAYSVDPDYAKEEWLRYQLPSRTLASILNQSRIFQYLTAAAPGLTEMVTIGKIWELAQLERKAHRAAPYDLVIVDAPATGHGIALMRAPRTFGDIARVGPIRRQAGIIDAFLRDPESTGIVAVALAEEMPVNETIELEGQLRAELGQALDRVFVNAVLPQRFSAAEAQRLAAAADGSAGLAAAHAAYEQARLQRSQTGRLRRGVDAPVATLPHLMTPEVGIEEVERLSREIERKL